MTDADELVQPLHNRMPVILHRQDYTEWLATGTTSEHLKRLLRPYPAAEMEAYPVSKRVNKPQNEGKECIEPT
jgi:putative SOS response-associated peptidase YedK